MAGGPRYLLLLAGVFSAVLALRATIARQVQGDEKPAAQRADLIEKGNFRLHKFEQPIGEETYQIRQDGASLTVTVDFKFNDRGTDVPLSATFRCSSDLTPQAFEIKGKTSRLSTVDEAVEVQAGKVRLRNRKLWTEATPPSQFFTIAGYAPSTMQMLLVRYWAAHGSPPELATLPSGHVRIEPRGEDTVSIDGKSEALERYTVEGLIWGRETLWFKSHRDLIAAVTIDAEEDHFEAVRDGYESALGTLVGRAGADGMAAMADVSKGITGSRAATVALVGGTLVDGTGRPALSDATVVIRDGRIVAVGPYPKIKIPRNAEVVDARGKTILPGLWDMHAHFEQVEWGPIYLAAGVTTVRDCGNEFEFITAVRDAIAQGRGLGPRILAAGLVDGSGPRALGVARVDAPEQARQWVDRYHDAGFQQMKIYSSVKLEEVKAVAEEAHRLGMTVTGHVPEGLNAYQVIEAGQDQINHVPYVTEMMLASLPASAQRIDRLKAVAALNLNSTEAQKAISFLKEHHTVIDPTLAFYEFISASTARPLASFEPGVDKVAPELANQFTDVGSPAPPPYAEVLEKAFAMDLAIVAALHRAGIPIVAGTDQTVPGHSLHREIELYTQAGFTPLEAIQAATIVPARVMGLDRELGTVEVGKRADLILLGANPLDDIRNIRKVEFVVTDGKMYNCAGLWRSVGFKP
jgi:imidazolonepropionase-like amidohydrolase